MKSAMPNKEQLQPLWIAISLDPITETVTILGVAKTEEESRAHFARIDNDAPFRHTFNFMADDIRQQLFSWFRHHKVVESEAKNIIKGIATDIYIIMKEADNGTGDRSVPDNK